MDQSDSDLRKTLSVLRGRIWLIIATTVLAAGSAYAFSSAQQDEYSAKASLLFRDPGFDQRLFGSSGSQPFQDPAREAATNVRLVSLEAVADRTAQDLGRLDGSAVSGMIEVEPEGQSDVVATTATDEDPQFAATVANAFASNYIVFRRQADRAKVADALRLVEGQYERLLPEEQVGQEGQALQKQISDLKTLEALQTGNAELVQRADVPTSPSSPQPKRDALIGGILGLVLGLGLALLRERLDRRLKGPEELGDAFALPVLGTIPDSRALRHDRLADAEQRLPAQEAEAFRLVRTRLRYFNVDRELHSLLIASAAESEGKTTVAFCLARAAAAAGSKTLLLEADFHQAALAVEFGLSPIPGLAEVLTHQATTDAVIQRLPIWQQSNGARDARNLDVIVAGAIPPNPLELVESHEMSKLLDELRTQYELVIIDTPPAGAVADALPLMRAVNGVIIVARLDKTTRDEATTLRDHLDSMQVSPLGLVINRFKARRGYGYGYGYAGPTPPRLGRAVRDRERASRPRLGESREGAPVAGAPAARTRGSNGAQAEADRRTDSAPPSDALTILNYAGVDALQRLGLSSRHARRIASHREQAGEFQSIDDLDRVPGLSKRVRADVRRRLTGS
jgi:capsular exopolysaccharide synthesis family protein